VHQVEAHFAFRRRIGQIPGQSLDGLRREKQDRGPLGKAFGFAAVAVRDQFRQARHRDFNGVTEFDHGRIALLCFRRILIELLDADLAGGRHHHGRRGQSF
jgi:hypothetical protein